MITIRTVISERLLMSAQNHSNKVRQTDTMIYALRYNGVSFLKAEVFNDASIAIEQQGRDLRVSHRGLAYHDRLTEAAYYNGVQSRPLISKNDDTIGSDLHLFVLI